MSARDCSKVILFRALQFTNKYDQLRFKICIQSAAVYGYFHLLFRIRVIKRLWVHGIVKVQVKNGVIQMI